MGAFVKQHDTLPPLQATLQQPAGSSIDISGATVLLHMQHTGGLASVSGVCTVVSGPSGGIRYYWRTDGSDTAVAGNYAAEFEVRFSSTGIQTVPNDSQFTVIITPELG